MRLAGDDGDASEKTRRRGRPGLVRPFGPRWAAPFVHGGLTGGDKGHGGGGSQGGQPRGQNRAPIPPWGVVCTICESLMCLVYGFIPQGPMYPTYHSLGVI